MRDFLREIDWAYLAVVVLLLVSVVLGTYSYLESERIGILYSALLAFVALGITQLMRIDSEQ